MLEYLNKDELEAFHIWNNSHKCWATEDSGTTGGRLTYCFIPTGIGVVKVIKCACGEEINVTDYESW